jgi:hypothetical protein
MGNALIIEKKATASRSAYETDSQRADRNKALKLPAAPEKRPLWMIYSVERLN